MKINKVNNHEVAFWLLRFFEKIRFRLIVSKKQVKKHLSLFLPEIMNRIFSDGLTRQESSVCSRSVVSINMRSRWGVIQKAYV